MRDRIALGIIRKAHGVRGEASVEPWTDSFERFAEIRAVKLVSPDEQHVRDATIEIPESEARAREADQYFLHELIGLRIVDASGSERGEVIDAYEGGGGVLLNVKRADGKEYEVPFAAAICTEIDIAGKKIVVQLPEGIDED